MWQTTFTLSIFLIFFFCLASSAFAVDANANNTDINELTVVVGSGNATGSGFDINFTVEAQPAVNSSASGQDINVGDYSGHATAATTPTTDTNGTSGGDSGGTPPVVTPPAPGPVLPPISGGADFLAGIAGWFVEPIYSGLSPLIYSLLGLVIIVILVWRFL